MCKRMLVATCAGVGLAALAQVPKPMPYTVPFEKQYRVILCMDTANEVDDALAIVHALLTPQFDVKCMIAEQFRVKKEDRVKRPPLELSVAETERVFDKAGFLGKMPILRGAAEPMIDDKTPQDSEGARFIIAEALKDDRRPLFVCCGGPLTDIASAILLEPSITNRLTITWSGGGVYAEDGRAYGGGGGEYNWSSDPHSVNTVFSSLSPVWQFPSDVYSHVRVTTARLALNMRPRGEIGKYLFDTMMAFNEKMKNNRGWPRGEDWTDGDAPFIGVLLDQARRTNLYDMRPAPFIDPKNGRYLEPPTPNRPIRVYTKIDGETIIEDFFAKLALAYPTKENDNE